MNTRSSDTFLTHCDLVVIGSGPAGLMSALFAAYAGRKIVILERMPKPASKLLATGGGRCNITNSSSDKDMCDSFGDSARFVKPAIKSFGSEKLRNFFSKLGVECVAEDGFHYFPTTQSARTVLNALVDNCTDLGVRILTLTTLEGVIVRDGKVAGVQTSSGRIATPAVVLAAGGKSWSRLGSDGSGLEIAARLGLQLVEPVPALTGVYTKETWPSTLAGVVLKRVEIAFRNKGGKLSRYGGELLFTHNGISGPSVLDCSGEIARLLLSERSVPIMLDLLPGISREELEAKLISSASEAGKKQVKSFLANYLPQSLVSILCELCSLEAVTLASLTAKGRKELLGALKENLLTVTKTDPFEKAMLTDGGVCRDEINPKTMQARKLSGLFLAGEIIDVNGLCGGYNLQWAFSSGRLAGVCASNYIESIGMEEKV